MEIDQKQDTVILVKTSIAVIADDMIDKNDKQN